MKNELKKIILMATGFLLTSIAWSQNVSLNMLVLNSGVINVNGPGTLQATVNATVGTGGQSNAVAAGKLNIQVTVPPSITIATVQNDLPAGWSVRNNNGTVINLCNSSTTLAVNTAIDLKISLQGVSETTGAPTMSGQLSFKSNCSAPGSLSGDNPSDNLSQAGFSVSGTVPVKLTNFNAGLINCIPVLKWNTETEINSDRFEIERSYRGAANWITAGTLTAGGFSNSRLKYSFTDNSNSIVNNTILYRLKMIDRDGRFNYSAVLPVRINCSTATVMVYPNPVQNGKMQVSLTGSNEAAAAMLLSVEGKVVLKTTLENGTQSLDVSTVANGLYLLSVDFKNGENKKLKVIVQR
jgi:hypothetical protein